MKKNFFYKLLVAVLVMVGATALESRAQSFQSLNFLKGSYLFIGPGTTNTFNGTNVYQMYGSSYGPAYATTTNSVTGGSTLGTNTPLTVVNVTNASAIYDIPLFADRDGSFPSSLNVTIHIAASSAIATNAITFAIAGVPRGVGYPASTSTQNQWSFTVLANGTNDVYYATNVPSAPFYGDGALRLLSITSPTNAWGTNVSLVSFSLNGFHP